MSLYEPAILPMYSVEVSIPVRALTTNGEVKKGSDYQVGIIRKDGMVHLIGHTPGVWYHMDKFVELLPIPRDLSREGRRKDVVKLADNDNKPAE